MKNKQTNNATISFYEIMTAKCYYKIGVCDSLLLHQID